MSVAVKLISAPWCKRCDILKPEIERICAISGASLTIINFDELEEDDELKLNITALPTILMRKGAADWMSYTPNHIENWKEDIVSAAAITTDTDF